MRGTDLANHSFDILVIFRSSGWTRRSQSNIAAGISGGALWRVSETKKLITEGVQLTRESNDGHEDDQESVRRG